MRISTANQYNNSIADLQQRQSDLQASQEQLTTGKRVSVASDDPTAAAENVRAQSALDRLTASQSALQASTNNMTSSESALSSATDLLQQARSDVVQAGDASYTDAERATLANQLQGVRTQLLAIANTSDGNGGYLFAGQGSQGQPFVDAPGGVQFIGTPGTLSTGNGQNFPLTMDGNNIFMQSSTGNGTFVTAAQPNANTGDPDQGWIDSGAVTNASDLTGDNYTIQISGAPGSQNYTVTDTTTGGSPATGSGSGSFSPGQAIAFDGMSVTVSGTPADGDTFTVAPSKPTSSIFSVLDKTISDLSTPNRGASQISQANSSDLTSIDSAISNFSNAQSLAGDTLNNLQSTSTLISGQVLFNQTAQSNATDLDMTQGISSFQSQQTGYQAALQTYASVQRMSLLNYISTSSA